MNKAEPWQLEIIAICTWCLGQQHFGPGPAGVQACETRDCECWCRKNDGAASELYVIGTSLCDKIAAAINFIGFSATGQQVADELAKPKTERGVIGKIAAEILKGNGVTEYEVDYAAGAE